MSDTNAKPTIHHLFILDESGSMSSIRQQTISAFNELMSHNTNLLAANPDQEHRLSFVTFNGKGIRTVCFNAPLTSDQLLNEANYNPSDNTPLYDAIGSSILKVKQEAWGKPDYNVLVTIFTDGMENDSKEFTGKEIKLMVEELKTKGWAFTYLGTDHDIDAAADAMAFHKGARKQWDKTDLHETVELLQVTRNAFAHRVHYKTDLNADLLLDAEKELQKSKKKD